MHKCDWEFAVTLIVGDLAKNRGVKAAPLLEQLTARGEW